MAELKREYGGGIATLMALPDPKPGSVGEVLANAIAWLDHNGWCQFVARNNQNENCGHGSIMDSVTKQLEGLPATILSLNVGSVSGGDPDMPFVLDSVPNPALTELYSAEVEAHRFLMQAAENAGWKSENGTAFDLLFADKPYKDAFAVFNDDPNTTVEDVKLMMKEAIKLADEAGV